MSITIRPAIQKLIDDEVKAGHYPSSEAVVEAAVLEMFQPETLDTETIAAINRAEAEGDRGEGIDFDMFRESMMKRIAGK